jgi:hypothetical protein
MQQSLEYTPTSLSIRILPDGFSLFVYGENKKLLSHKTIKEDLTHVDSTYFLSKLPEITRSYNQISVIVETDFYTFVPGDFSNPHTYRSLLSMQHPMIDEEYAIFYESIQKTQVIYAIPRQLIQNIHTYFPEAGFYLHLSPVLKENLEIQGDQLLVYIRQNSIDCLIIRKKNLFFTNHFSYKSVEDSVYHCFHLIDHYQLIPGKVKVCIYGTDELVRPDKLLKAYLPAINYIKQTEAYENYQW